MLVLSRAKGEGLMIGNNILVQIVEITPDKVRLGITCPKDVPVHRREVWEALQQYSPAAPADEPK